MPTLRFAVRALACAVLAVTVAACSHGSRSQRSSSGKTIVIGIDLPLSGADASVGESTRDGMLLAVEQARSAGLPDGYTLRVETLDDAVQGVHSPQQGAANVRRFAADPAVLAVLGPYNSNVAAAEIPIANAAQLALVSPSAVADGLTVGPTAEELRRANPGLNTFFRLCATDTRQGSAAARFAIEKGWKRAYIIDDNETYGLDLARVFEHDYRALGGVVVGHDHIEAGTQDFKALLTKVAGTRPQVVFYGGTTSTGGGLIRQQMAAAGLDSVPFLGGDGIPDIAQAIGAAADGTYYTIAAPDVLRLPQARAFVTQYERRFKSPVGPYSANGYAAAEVVVHAIEAAILRGGGAMPSRADVVSAIAATRDLPTPVGPVSFDAAGDLRHPIVSLYEIVHGTPQFIEQFAIQR